MSTKDRLKTICVITFIALFATLYLTSERISSVRANASGPPAGHTGAPSELTCAIAGCHGGEPNTGPGQFTIEAPERYQPGETLQITVRHAVADNTRRRWGFQLTALTNSNARAGTLQSDGTLSILSDDGPGFNRQYIEHGIESTFLGRTGGASWTFNWVAPSDNVGPVTLYAAGNQANGDGTNAGDRIYTTSTTINPPSVGGAPGISAAAVNGKKLFVSGTNFDFGATLLMDGQKQKKTTNDPDNPSTMLVAKKSGKNIDRGATVTLQVKNPDGTLSEPFSFTRP